MQLQHSDRSDGPILQYQYWW